MFFSHGEIFLMNRPLGFCVFCFLGSFRDIWCLDFWFSVDSDSCVSARADVRSGKGRNCRSLETSGSFHDTGMLGVLGLMVCADKVFSISGVWIFEFSLWSFSTGVPHDFSLWWIDPWVFMVSLVFGGLFAISGVWIFGFCRLRLLRMRACRCLVRKRTELLAAWEIS